LLEPVSPDLSPESVVEQAARNALDTSATDVAKAKLFFFMLR